MKTKEGMEINKIHNINFLDNTLPDKSAQLIIADPPYFEIKGDFDFIWASFDDYLKDVERWAIECKRILADNGTLYWWGHARNIAYSQVILDKYFRLMNNAVWRKRDTQTLKVSPSELRRFAPQKEHLLVYEQMNENGDAKTGTQAVLDDNNNFQPIKKYFDDWLDASGLTLREATQKIGSSCTHWFGFSKRDKVQFMFPTLEKFELMNSIHPTTKTYESLRQEYESLRQEYESLKRPFNLPYLITDVLDYLQESHITGQYDHDTKKPETLTRMLITVSSRPNDLVVVPFSGSGTECAMSAREGRNFIGFDIEAKYCEMGNKRAKWHLKQKSLF